MVNDQLARIPSSLRLRCFTNRTHCVAQAALGELTFESEAADRLRVELRSAQRQVADLLQQLQQSADQLQSAQEAQVQAQKLAADASHGSEEQQRAEKQLQVRQLSLEFKFCFCTAGSVRVNN